MSNDRQNTLNQKDISLGSDPSGSYASHLEYNKILRTWFVTFGIGCPALFLVNKELATQLVKLGELHFVAVLFLIGAATQILGSLVNKFSNWYIYCESIDTDQAGHWKYKVSAWLIDQIWIDIFLDLITIVCYGLATWKVLTAFAPQS